MATAESARRVGRELGSLLASAIALGLVAWCTHGVLGIRFVAACGLAGAVAVCLTEYLSPKSEKPLAPVARYLVGGLLRTTLLLAVPIALVDRSADGQGVLVLYAFAMLVVLLGMEIREAVLANRARANPAGLSRAL